MSEGGSLGLRLKDITVGKKIGLFLLAMLLVSGISTAIVWQNVQSNEESGTAVNVAGSNRMLSQRLAFTSFMIKDGHHDEEMLNATVERVESNLDALDDGGTVGDQSVPPAPPKARDELQQVKSDWPELQSAAETVAEAEPYSAEFQKAEEYVIQNNDQLLAQSNDVVVAYKEADTSGEYSDEIDIAGRQRMLSQRIAKLVTTISSKSQVQGAEASEILEHQDGEEMQQLRDELRSAVNEYDSALNTLENGGTHKGMTLQPAPSSVQDEIAKVRTTWAPFREEATTAATVDKLNPEFWRSLGTIEGGADPFRNVNDDLTSEIAQVSRERSTTMQRILLALLGVNAVVFLGGFVLTRRTVSQPLQQMRDEAEKIASKDLTSTKVASTDRDDEIGELGCSFRDMLGNLRTMVSDLKSNSATVASSAEELAAANEETNAASEEVATMVQEINDAAQRQAEQADKAARQLQELSDHAKTISRSAERAEDVSSSAEEKAEEGGNAAVEAMDTMEEIQEVVEDSADEVQELGEKSDEIGRIVDVITEMAEQTNLLALNAAIEAARAGEEGEGFAVVAEEIRSLAEESTEAASQISDLIDEIQGQTDDAVVAMRQGTEKVSDGTEVVNDALSALQEITGSVQETSGKVQEISGAAEKQADMVREAAASIDDISSKAEETADNTEDVSAAAEEQTASMQQVSSSSQELSGISEDLKAMVEEFEVEDS